MVQQSLVDYIESQLKRGYNLYQVKQYLLSAGYNPGDVEDAINYVANLRIAPDKAALQRVKHLSEYIQKQIETGYSIEQVQSFLVKYGYPFEEIQEAINISQTEKVKGTRKLVFVTIAVIFLLVAAAVSVTFFVQLEEKPAKLLDIKLKKLTTLPAPGDELTIQVDLFNFGAKKRYDIQLEYQIVDQTTNNAIVSHVETLAVETSLSHVISFDLPKDMIAGDYLFRVDAKYDDQSARAGFIFKVYAKEEKVEKIEEVKPVTEEELGEVPGLIPTEPEVPEEEVPAEAVPGEEPTAPLIPIIIPEKKEYPFEGMTRTEAFDLIQRTAVRDVNKAIEMCKSFTYEGTIETCLTELAVFKQDSNICSKIEDIHDRDACYLQLFIETKDVAYCASISTEQVKTSCELLSTVNQAEALAEQNRGGEIPGLFGYNITV